MMLRRINTLVEPIKFTQIFQINQWKHPIPLKRNEAYSYSTTSEVNAQPKKNMSKAMKAYLERAREHDEFMKRQKIEYEIGKRHLANMMGENPDTFSQEDVDNAVAYLFPSGLFETKARPMIKPPEEIFPLRKAAEFDETGRPHHYLFYTGKPNYYKLLYDIDECINESYKFEDTMIKRGLQPDPNVALELSGYQWVDKITLETILVETLTDRDYNNFITTIERLCELPYSYRVKDFILKYTKPLLKATTTYEAPQPQYDENGRAYITVYECLRKRARGHVTLRSPGTGIVSINGHDITYFEDMQSREQCFKCNI